MDYNTLLDAATDLGYELSMSGAETFRVEESIHRMLASYGVEAEVFAIPNYLVVCITTETGKPITRMRRIGYHGNDLDSVEKFNGLSRAICTRTPEPKEIQNWLEITRSKQLRYSAAVRFLGYFLGAAGYCLFFGGNGIDALCAGVCGMLIGAMDLVMNSLKANQFFRTISESFIMAAFAYLLGNLHIAQSPDAVIIGALMLLVPGLLFTNAMRDIIYGDTSSGVTRIVQVFLVAMAIALGTASAWNVISFLWRTPVSPAAPYVSGWWQCLYCLIGCVGFSILFNIHGPGGLLCALGGTIAWAVYCLTLELGGSAISAYFFSAVTASVYAETMARVRKYPAISYLVVAIFPLIPGAGVYFAMNYAVRGQMDLFANQGMFTIAIAGIMAVGILLVSTVFRMYSDWKFSKIQGKRKHK